MCWRVLARPGIIPEIFFFVRARAAVHPIHLWLFHSFFYQEIYRRFLLENKIGDLSEMLIGDNIGDFFGDLYENVYRRFIGDLSETLVGDELEIISEI